jgi:RNA polymerase sigma-70 factor (ECF subfamily)
MINKVYIEYLILKNDKVSFQKVLPIIQPKLLAFAYSILKENDLAQDAVQEAMLGIIKGTRKLKDHRKFHAWIYQITRNKCFDIIRKNQKYKNDSHLDAIQEPQSDNTNIDEKLDMIMLIKQLPENQKNIIHLFYYTGLSILEIAEILQKPAGTIKSWLFEARNNLKQCFGED